MYGKLQIDFENYQFKQPSEQNITLQHLMKDLFPYFRFKSITAILIIIQIILYLLQIASTYISSTNSQKFTYLVQSLSFCPELIIKQYQIYRVFSSLVTNSTIDTLLLHTFFGLVVLAFVEKKIGPYCLMGYFVATGTFGNLLTMVFNSHTNCTSNIGSLSIFCLSLKLQYQIFQCTTYSQYQNYSQSYLLYIYKLILFSFALYQFILESNSDTAINFNMYLGGLLSILLLQILSYKTYIIMNTFLIIIFGLKAIKEL